MPSYNNMITEVADPGVHFGFNRAINPRASSERKIVPTEGGHPVRASNQVAFQQGPDLQREEARSMLIAVVSLSRLSLCCVNYSGDYTYQTAANDLYFSYFLTGPGRVFETRPGDLEVGVQVLYATSKSRPAASS